MFSTVGVFNATNGIGDIALILQELISFSRISNNLRSIEVLREMLLLLLVLR